MMVEAGLVEGGSRTSSTFFGGGNAVDEFKDALVSKFGTLSRAWRLGLDVDGSGKMDMREFCEALRRLGYVGNIRTLWHLLEGGNSGTISFDELDRKAAAALEKFRVMSLMNHKSIEHMWKVVMDKDRSNHVGLPLFLEGCKALGYEDEEEVKELFEHLLLRGGSRNLSVEDIVFLQSWEKTKRKKAERRRLGVRWVNRDPFLTARVLDPSRSSDLFGSEEYSNRVSVDWDEEVRKFRVFLIKTFGSLSQAFEAIDANKSGELSLVEFQAAVAQLLKYCRHGEAKQLFRTLVHPGNVLTWQELGISKVEWTAHRMQKALNARRLDVQAKLNALAPLGASPRMRKAETSHILRIREQKPSGKFVFNSPLPPGWGPPPEYVPLEPPRSSQLRKRFGFS